MNNGLRSKDCILLIDSLQRHFQKLNVLNLAKNKLGFKGAKHLAEALKQMKLLSTLNLSENEIGDGGITEIVKSLNEYVILESLDISGNCIGKTSQSIECSEVIYDYLKQSRNLETLKMNWNNLRGQVGEKIIDGIGQCYTLKYVHLNNNLLGVAYEGI